MSLRNKSSQFSSAKGRPKEEKNTFDKVWATKLGEGTRVFLQPRKIAG